MNELNKLTQTDFNKAQFENDLNIKYKFVYKVFNDHSNNIDKCDYYKLFNKLFTSNITIILDYIVEEEITIYDDEYNSEDIIYNKFYDFQRYKLNIDDIFFKYFGFEKILNIYKEENSFINIKDIQVISINLIFDNNNYENICLFKPNYYINCEKYSNDELIYNIIYDLLNKL